MPRPRLAQTPQAEAARQRLTQWLNELKAQGYSQAHVARRAGVPAQYVSDVKRGRRPMTELLARRLAEGFGLDHVWLQGLSADASSQSAEQPPYYRSESALLIPVLPRPVTGDPHTSPDWDGSVIELAGPAAATAIRATQPYALRLGDNDGKGRLRTNDVILITQTDHGSSEVKVVSCKGKLKLARKRSKNKWASIRPGEVIKGDVAVVGACVGVIWASL